ncbi:leucine zipper transcription factor-like protein 1 isoform X1 [Oscarella lobularis]|uniref:leucine zipper transcription factor-like protein 1 isoform X1 n=2 Tax=Oscarella lobularis TaxID=121494 RepID=UPI00331323E9
MGSLPYVQEMSTTCILRVFVSSRLTEETFTAEELRDMLFGLCAVVKGDVESELIHTTHTNVLLLRQVFRQAEKWHLKLSADVSELENQELIDEIARFAEKQFASSGLGSATASKTLPAAKTKLEPLNEAGGSALLQMEISRLKEENENMKERMRMIEGKAHDALEEKGKLKSQLVQAEAALKAKETKSSAASDVVPTTSSQSKAIPVSSGKSSGGEDNGKLREELGETKHELLAIKAKLENAEKELEKKLGETAQFTNMKKMLAKKNEQLIKRSSKSFKKIRTRCRNIIDVICTRVC